MIDGWMTQRALRIAAVIALGAALAACGAGASDGSAEATGTGATVATQSTVDIKDLRQAPSLSAGASAAIKPSTAPVAATIRPGPAFSAMATGASRAPHDAIVAQRRPAVLSATPGRARTPGAADSFGTPVAAGGYVGECLVDFKDEDALTATGYYLYFDRIYVPWFQRCGAGGYVDLRPMFASHVHLAFASVNVLPCNSTPDAFPSRIDEDGTCHPVDIPTEPRTYIVTHSPTEIVRIRALSYNSPLPDYTPLVFDLNRVRVIATSGNVRVCYRKAQQDVDGPWLADAPDGPPAVWMCWNNLGPGHWDLSDWATELSEARVTGADGELNPVTIDDVKVGIR